MNKKPSPRIVLFNKPFQVLCQFSEHEGKRTLAKYINTPDIYAAGRLDYDSEGLLILTDSGALQSLITHPQNKLEKTYWVQVEGDIHTRALQQLEKGVSLKDGTTLPAQIKVIPAPEVWERTPPIRKRENNPTSWIELRIKEGKNRQVRRMTAAVGFPTLRLIRYGIGPWNISNLGTGKSKECDLPSELETQLTALMARKTKQPKKHLHQKTNRNAKSPGGKPSHSKKRIARK